MIPTLQACMLSSSMFHTMSCHDSRTTWQRIDHASILIALYGTYVRVIVNNFDCFPQHKALHLVTVTALFGSVLYLKTKTSSGSRVSLPLFLFMALYSVAPFAHWVSLSHLQTNTNITDTVGTCHRSFNCLVFTYQYYRCSGGWCSHTWWRVPGSSSTSPTSRRSAAALGSLISTAPVTRSGTS